MSGAAPTQFDKLCAVSQETLGPKLTGDPSAGNADDVKRLWREVLLGAERRQFVSAKVDVTVRYALDMNHSIKGTIKAGEPVLVQSCTSYGGKWVKVRSIDGLFDHSFRPDDLVLEPASFTFPAEPAKGEYRANDAVNNADPRDVEAVPGLRELQEKKGVCATEALGQCMAAEAKVQAGPWRADLAAAKRQACDAARDKVFKQCMSDKENRAFVAGAKKVYELTAKRDADFRATMQGKLK